MKALKSLSPLGVALCVGVSALTFSSCSSVGVTASLAPPYAARCVPFLNNLDALGSIDIVGNMPYSATTATGTSSNGTIVASYLTSDMQSLSVFGKNLATEASRTTTAPKRKAQFLAAVAGIRQENTYVRSFIADVRTMTATKNRSFLKMANADVAVDANKSCVIWGQHLIVGFVFTEETVSYAQVSFPGSNPNAVVTYKDLRIQEKGYGKYNPVAILSASPKHGPLRRAKLAVTEYGYTVNICLRFSGTHRETFTTAIC